MKTKRPPFGGLFAGREEEEEEEEERRFVFAYVIILI